MRIMLRPLLFVLVAGGLVAGGRSPARAGTGSSLRLPPQVAKKSTHGLTLSVDCEWVGGYGYRPVHLELNAVRTEKEDRHVTVDVGLSKWWGDNDYVTVSTGMTIPAGERSAQALVAVPQVATAQTVTVRTWAGGAQLKDLSTNDPLASANQTWGDDLLPRILFVSDGVPDVSSFSFLLTNPYYSYGNVTQQVQQPADVFALTHRSADQLYDEWIYYSALDMIFISLDDARQLASGRPRVWQALGAWHRAGGTLCVYGAGGNWENLAEVEKLCGCPAEEKEALLDYRGWESASVEFFKQQVIPAAMAAGTAGNGQPLVVAPSTPPVPSKVPFVWKTTGYGRVVALADAQPFPGDAARWRWLIESLGPNATRWSARYGAVPCQPNDQFNDFLIADVGLPPIRTYRVLISLFVVTIGPLNYWLLRRKGRLYLFLFTVPLAALVTSGGLMCYAMLSDGLAARLRARSLTHLDQQSGEAASIARLSYYVGLAPSSGLTFPRDTMVIPLELAPGDRAFDSSARAMAWNDAQHLTRGWLGSRMPTQYVTARAHPSERRLEIAASADGSRRLVKNRLGVPIYELLLCDESGNWHRGRNLEPDEQSPLVPLADKKAEDDAADALQFALLKNRPAPPAGMIGPVGTTFGIFNRHYYSYYGRQTYVDTGTSALEAGLGNLGVQIGSRALPPRTYVAVVARPDDVPVGLDDCAESESCHVIHGTW